MLKVTDLSVETAEISLEKVSFNLDAGKVLGVIGINGSGKSTLLQTLAGQRPSVSGKIILNHYEISQEPIKTRLHLGYLPSPVELEPYLTGQEYLDTIGSFYHLSPKIREEMIERLTELFSFKDALYRLSEQLSKGEQQILGLISTMLHRPSLLIWDDPTNFLDFHTQTILSDNLMSLTAEKVSAIISSNDLVWLESVADSYLILDKGRVVAQGTKEELSNQFQTKCHSLAELLEAILQR